MEAAGVDSEERRNIRSTPVIKRPCPETPVSKRSSSVGRRPLRPTSTTMRTETGVQVYTGQKNDWTIVPRDDTTTVVIGDSNLKRVPHVPVRWEVHSLPGATPAHVVRAVDRLQKTTALQNVIIQAGINYRGKGREDFIENEFRSMVSTLSQLNVEYAFVGISTSTLMPEAERKQCEYINEVARNTFGMQNYIAPLRQDDVIIEQHDMLGIHYNTNTTDRVMQSIASHIVPNLVFPRRTTQ